MKEIKELFEHRKETQGSINLTLFFVNIFLMISHIFLMVIYVLIGHKFLICLNSLSFLTSIYFFKNCYKYRDVFIGLSFFEVWIHMIFGTMIFGWNLGFQNWAFAMVTAYFLPAFSNNQERRPRKQSIFYACVIMLSYFLLAVYVFHTTPNAFFPLNRWMIVSLFLGNNIMAFFTIIMFAIYYTSRRERKERELTRKADYDELTGLYNRHALIQVSEQIAMDAKDTKNPYSVAILDLDFFKKVNDDYGHTSGDDVLKEFASILRSYSIKGIICGRWGGEEFVMIAPHNIKYSEFINILEKLRRGVSRADFIIENNKEIHITVSIGAEKIRKHKSLEDSINMADSNLYQAKQEGRNRVIG